MSSEEPTNADPVHVDTPQVHTDTTTHSDVPAQHADLNTGWHNDVKTPHIDSRPHVDQTVVPHGDAVAPAGDEPPDEGAPK